MPAQFARQKVQIRYHPLDLQRLQVWQHDRLVAHAEVLDLRQGMLRQVVEAHRLPDPQAGRIPYLELLVQQRERRTQASLSPLRFSPQEVDRHV